MAIADNNIQTAEAIMAKIFSLELHTFLHIMGDKTMVKILGIPEVAPTTGQADSKVQIITMDLETSNLLEISQLSLNQILIIEEIFQIIIRETPSEIQKRTILVSRNQI